MPGELLFLPRFLRTLRPATILWCPILPGVAKVERVGVGADARVLAVEREDDARLLLDDRVDRFKACANRFEGERFAESEVQVFRETIVGKVASLQRRASLERKNGRQIGLRERAEEPSETVVPFEDVFANASCSAGCEAVGEPRNVSLWNRSSAPDGQQLFGWDVRGEPIKY